MGLVARRRRPHTRMREEPPPSRDSASGKDGQCRPFHLEGGFGDVTEILAIGLKRQRTVATRFQTVDVVETLHDMRRTLAGDDVSKQRRDRVRPHALRGDYVK